mgnify:CR=1 FL=1
MTQYKKIFTSTAILLCSSVLFGQLPVNLDKAVRIALQNNAKLRTENQYVAYQNALTKTAYTIAPTDFNVELGQINSVYFDNGLSVSQTFSMPQVYKRRAAALLQKAKAADFYLKMTEAEIRQQLDEIFAEYGYLVSKEALLAKQDQLYSVFVEKSLLRWQKGESDILEKSTAEQQKIQLAQQIAILKQMQDLISLQLSWLLNDGQNYVPEVEGLNTLSYNIFYDSLSIRNHPALQAAAQDIESARMNTLAEKAALLPEWTIGYKNISIRGIGADDKLYQASDRFSSFQIGIGIPLFQKSIRAAIASSRLMEAAKANEYEAKKLEILKNIRQQYALYNTYTAQIAEYEQKALLNAKLIREVSIAQYENGQINYLEYVMLNNQAIDIENQYLELKRNLNMSIINLYYLTNSY